MNSLIGFFLQRLRERLWLKPLVYCLLAVGAVLVAHTADFTGLDELVPEISPDIVDKLLSIMSTSMLPIATFAVASMISAYSSASGSATPRVFPLIVADDVSQTALSSFIATFIYSVVALVAVSYQFYGRAGTFCLFVITLLVFAWVVLVFVRWVDKIARLGRMGTTIQKVESATKDALRTRRLEPTLGGVPADGEEPDGEPLFAQGIGYVQHINMPALQKTAADSGCRIFLDALPGTFAAPGRPLLHVARDDGAEGDLDTDRFLDAFIIGDQRTFQDDPRFGLIALSEIAARALSPAVNDPGTAIAIIGSHVRLLDHWTTPLGEDEGTDVQYDRIVVPCLSVDEMLDDCFTVIARDGAPMVEVGIRLQKAFLSLAAIGDDDLTQAVRRHARLAIERAKHALNIPEDLERLRDLHRLLDSAAR